MGDVVPFPRDRGRPPSPELLRAYRDAVLSLLGRLLAAVDGVCPASAHGADRAAWASLAASLAASRDMLAAWDLGSAALAEADPERLDRIASGLLATGRRAAELAQAVAGLVAGATAGRADEP